MDATWSPPVFVVVFLVVLLMSPHDSRSQTKGVEDDGLVRAMELEISIHELARQVMEMAGEKAEEAVKKTTLYKRYEVALAEFHAFHEADVGKEERKTMIARGDLKGWKRVTKQRLAELESRRLAFAKLGKEVDVIVEKFRWRIYQQEMKKRLTELEIEMTKEVLKKIERSYKEWEA